VGDSRAECGVRINTVSSTFELCVFASLSSTTTGDRILWPTCAASNRGRPLLRIFLLANAKDSGPIGWPNDVDSKPLGWPIVEDPGPSDGRRGVPTHLDGPTLYPRTGQLGHRRTRTCRITLLTTGGPPCSCHGVGSCIGFMGMQ
jgi:hypothetical protein